MYITKLQPWNSTYSVSWETSQLVRKLKLKKNCQKKLKINFFLQKILKDGHLEGKAYGESKKN